MTLSELDQQDSLKHLLESPAPIVVGRLIDQLRKYVAFAEELKLLKRQPLDEDIIDTLLEKHEI